MTKSAKGKEAIVLPKKRKAEFCTPAGEKLMKDAIGGMRPFKRLAKLRVFEKPPKMTENKETGSMAEKIKVPDEIIDVEQYGRPTDVYVPFWDVSRTSRLMTIDEKEDWAEGIMPPRARTKFDMLKESELVDRINNGIYEYVGILLKAKTELKMQLSMKEKLKEDLQKNMIAYNDTLGKVRRLELEKTTLEAEKEVLKMEKADL